MTKRPILAAVALLGIGLVFGVLLVTNFSGSGVSSMFAGESRDIGSKSAPVTTTEQANALNNAFIAVSKAVNPTVVSISVVTESKSNDGMEELFRFFGSPFGEEAPAPRDGGKRRSTGAGSGVIITADGYIATNNHVVEDAIEDGIKVMMSDKKEYKAKLVGRDPLTDLALLKIEASGLPTAHIGNSDKLQVGEWVVAVGNPMGLQATTTQGIVSALGRGSIGTSRESYAVENFIQTDAPINPGNSGGGLFNLQGSLIGINTAIYTRTGGSMGIGFAIPSNLAKAVLIDLMDDGKVDRGYIGVEIRSVDEVIAKAEKLDKIAGAIVNNVLKDSPAEKAGVEVGDIILDLDGTPVNSSNELQSLVAQRRAGQTVKLNLWRDGKQIQKSVVLKRRDGDNKFAENDNAKPGMSPTDDSMESNKPVTFKGLGFTIGPLTEKARKDSEVTDGVLVTGVERFSHAAEQGIVPNVVIVKAERQNVTTTGQLKSIIEKKRGDVVRLQVKAKEANRLIFLEIPKDNI